MKTFSILLLSCFIFSTLQAQYGYTYISDRRFTALEDLVGYDFRPIKMEIKDKTEQDLSPGEFSFGISFNNLYVEGEGITGVYNINNIQPAEYGYKLLLMNARDARLQGHLKLILNKYSMVEALIFRRAPQEPEIIFYQAPISTKLNNMEREYFTDRGELIIEDTDSLWGKSIYPFFRIHLDRNVQEPLDMGDSTSITFIKEIIIEEKEKKKKSKKNQEEEVIAATEESPNVENKQEVVENDMTEKKVKIIKKYFIEIRSILQYDDGIRKDKVEKIEIKKIVEREDKYAKMEEERFQIELHNSKGEKIYLYLRGDRTASTFEVGNRLFLMRGY